VLYELFLESGPQHRKTWVFVPSLPGCVAVGPTTVAAIEISKSAIAARLGFLRRHGDHQADAEPIEVVVAEHVIERQLLGFGQQFFAPDGEPLTQDEASRRLRWADWSREDLVAAARAQSEPLTVKPAAGGRSTAAILSHVAGAEWAYASATLGTLPGGSAAIKTIEEAGDQPWEALVAERAALMARLRAMTPDDLTRVVERGGKPRWTARRMLRRLLEHESEHTMELESRLHR
jgi:predicted RNase H-like HicB family nuclease